MQKIIDIILLWIARVMGVSLFAFFIWFAIEIGIPNFGELSNQEWILFISNIIMLLGIIVGLFFRFIGSLLIISFYTVFSIANHSFWVGDIFPFFLLSGLLYFISWIYSSFNALFYSKFKFRIFLN